MIQILLSKKRQLGVWEGKIILLDLEMSSPSPLATCSPAIPPADEKPASVLSGL